MGILLLMKQNCLKDCFILACSLLFSSNASLLVYHWNVYCVVLMSTYMYYCAYVWYRQNRSWEKWNRVYQKVILILPVSILMEAKVTTCISFQQHDNYFDNGKYKNIEFRKYWNKSIKKISLFCHNYLGGKKWFSLAGITIFVSQSVLAEVNLFQENSHPSL